MQHLLKRPGYRLYPPNSPEAGALLREQGLGPADLDRALARLESTEGTAVRTIVGINEDGVFGTGREGWRPDLPDACHEPFIPLLWLKLHELLGRVREGSTARFIEDGTLPGGAHGAATGFRLASLEPGFEALLCPLRRRGLVPGGALFAVSSEAAPDRACGSELPYGPRHRRLRWPTRSNWSRWLHAWSRAANTASCAASRWSPATPTMTLPP